MTRRTPMPPEAKTNGGRSWKGGRSRRIHAALTQEDTLWMTGWLKERRMSWGDYLTDEIRKLRTLTKTRHFE